MSSVPEPDGQGAPFLIQYEATDPDGDPLTVRVVLVQQSEAVGAPPLSAPIVIAEGLPATGSFLWDTRSIPDGAGYRIRVEATDSGEGGVPGSGGTPLTGADETDGRFLVDNTAPTASLAVVEGDYLYLDHLPLTATVGDLPFFPPEGVVHPHARPLHITLTLDPGAPGELALEPGGTLDLATVAPGRHRLRLHVRDQSHLVTNDVRVIHVLTAVGGFTLVQDRLEALQADPTTPPGAASALAEAHALLATALNRQRSGNVLGFLQKLSEAAGQLQIANVLEPRAGALAETLAYLVRDLLRARVEYLESTLGVADPRVTPIRGFFNAGLALLTGGNFSGAILEFKKAQNRVNALDTQSPEIMRLAPEERVLQSGEFTVRYAFSDFLTDVAPTSVLLEVDGVNRTAEATHGERRLRIDFAGVTALPEADHEFRLTVVDVQDNSATRVDRIWVDLAAPTAAWTSPAAGWVTSNRPLARVEYADPAPGSGIDPAEGVELFLDGANVSSAALRGEDFATHQTAAGNELTEGTHVYYATVQDRSGRTVTTERAFQVDSVMPSVTIVSPVDGSSDAEYRLDYRVLASDANGVALVSATINDQDVTGQFTTEPGGFLWHSMTGDPVFLHLGENMFRVTVADPAGNSVEREVRFTLTAGPGGGDPPPWIAPLYVLTIEDGDHQEGAIGQCLQGPPIPGTMLTEPGKPLRVSVRDDHNDGLPVAGLPLLWTGPGFVVEAPGFSTVSSSEGMAAVRYLLGRAAGPEKITCTVLGDESVVPVTFHATAVLPEWTVDMPYRAEENILLGSGEAFLKATLTRVGTIPPAEPGGASVEQVVRVQGSVRVEVLDETGVVLVDPPGLYVNPRTQTLNDRGQAGIDVIPDTLGPFWNEAMRQWVGPWWVRVTVDDFPELPPKTFELPCVSSAVRAGFMATPQLSGTPAGQITVHDHPIDIKVNMGAMRRADLGEGEVEHYTMYLLSPTDDAGLPIYEFGPIPEPPIEQSWFPGTCVIDGKTPNLAARVRPVAGTTGLRPTPVRLQLLYQILRRNEAGDWDGIYGWQRIETVGVGVPEVRFVQSHFDDTFTWSPFVPIDRVFTADWSPSARDPAREYQVEIRAPAVSGDPTSLTADLVQMDQCREAAADQPRQIGVRAASVTLPEIERSTRFTLYRSGSCQNSQQRSPRMLALEAPIDRTILFSDVGGATQARIASLNAEGRATNSGQKFVDAQGMPTSIVWTFVPSSGNGGGGPVVLRHDASDMDVTVRLDAPLSSSVRDTICVSFAIQYLGLIELDLLEDGADSRRFLDERGEVTFSIESGSAENPATREEIAARLRYSLTDGDAEFSRPDTALLLKETGPATLAFSNSEVTGSIDIPPAEPTREAFRVIEVSPLDSPDPRVVTLHCPEETIPLPLDRVAPHVYRSRKIVAVPVGIDATSILGREDLIVLRTGATSDPAFEVSVDGSPGADVDLGKEGLIFSSIKQWAPWSDAIRPIVRDTLAVPIAAEDFLTKQRVLELIPHYEVWYSSSHAKRSSEDHHFLGLKLKGASGEDLDFLTSDFPSGLAYDLVVLDGCKSAENLSWDPARDADKQPSFTESTVTRVFINKFGAKCFLGWQTAISSIDRGALRVMTAFFMNLDSGKSVQAAFSATQADGTLPRGLTFRLKLLSVAGADPKDVVIDRSK